MIVLSHRGYWTKEEEKNQLISFERSFDLGFGTELDLRDSNGKIVVSHDMPDGNEITFEEVLRILNGRALPIAVNIKADGQAGLIKEILEKYNCKNYFTFDMSIPEMLFQIKLNLNVFTGLSDISQTPVLFKESFGIWLDCFNSDWYEACTIDKLIDCGKKVCIVSADLHKRDVNRQWQIIKRCKNLENSNLMICSDYPKKANEYFNVKN